MKKTLLLAYSASALFLCSCGGDSRREQIERDEAQREQEIIEQENNESAELAATLKADAEIAKLETDLNAMAEAISSFEGEDFVNDSVPWDLKISSPDDVAGKHVAVFNLESIAAPTEDTKTDLLCSYTLYMLKKDIWNENSEPSITDVYGRNANELKSLPYLGAVEVVEYKAPKPLQNDEFESGYVKGIFYLFNRSSQEIVAKFSFEAENSNKMPNATMGGTVQEMLNKNLSSKSIGKIQTFIQYGLEVVIQPGKILPEKGTTRERIISIEDQ